MGIGRVLRPASSGRALEFAVEAQVSGGEAAPLVADYHARMPRYGAIDVRDELAAQLTSQDHLKAVCRGPGGSLEGVALLLTEGHATDIGFFHIMPRFASDSATATLLDTALAELPPGNTKVRAQAANAGRWLHISPARARTVLAARGFQEMSRVLMLRDLRKPLPPVPRLPAGYALTSPEPTRFEEWSHFAYTAYQGNTDFAVITLEETEEAYLRLYRRFLGGEFGPYARGLSFSAVPEGGGPAVGVLHTVFVGPDPYVGDLSLAPAHRGRGLGRHLLLTALAAYAASGATRTGLTATEQNRPAFTLYRSAGFEVVRSNDVYVRYA